jgi:hypothetical protein
VIAYQSIWKLHPNQHRQNSEKRLILMTLWMVLANLTFTVTTHLENNVINKILNEMVYKLIIIIEYCFLRNLFQCLPSSRSKATVFVDTYTQTFVYMQQGEIGGVVFTNRLIRQDWFNHQGGNLAILIQFTDYYRL